VLALPIYPELTQAQAETVVDAISPLLPRLIGRERIVAPEDSR
jgi:hypothetical protein